MKKVCPGCGEVRDVEKDFAWKNIAKGTRQRWCRFCQAEANRKHYQNNKQTYIDHAREYYQNNKQKYRDIVRKQAARSRVENQQRLYEYLSTHPCVDCGCDDIRVLEFDHVRGSKKADVAVMIRDGCSWSAIQAELAKCEVRCANCHRIKTLDGRGSWRSLFDG